MKCNIVDRGTIDVDRRPCQDFYRISLFVKRRLILDGQCENEETAKCSVGGLEATLYSSVTFSHPLHFVM